MIDNKYMDYPVKYTVEGLEVPNELLKCYAFIVVKCYVTDKYIHYFNSGIEGYHYKIEYPYEVEKIIKEYSIKTRNNKLKGDLFNSYKDAIKVRREKNNQIIQHFIRRNFDYDEYQKIGNRYLQEYIDLENEKRLEIQKYLEIENELLIKTNDLKIDKSRIRKL